MNSRASGSSGCASRAFDRLHPTVQRWVYRRGWRTLHEIQELAVEPILNGDDCIVAAPTAGGKTEAAFLPVCSAIASALSSDRASEMVRRSIARPQHRARWRAQHTGTLTARVVTNMLAGRASSRSTRCRCRAAVTEYTLAALWRGMTGDRSGSDGRDSTGMQLLQQQG
ncbi:MAG: DEAD/DEAH box helicase [candidate division WS1 bacterium]|jgi:hypothetical protein|nr:DEAD/DEAH box helicase [candidate division WS1 bacterium]